MDIIAIGAKCVELGCKGLALVADDDPKFAEKVQDVGKVAGDVSSVAGGLSVLNSAASALSASGGPQVIDFVRVVHGSGKIVSGGCGLATFALDSESAKTVKTVGKWADGISMFTGAADLAHNAIYIEEKELHKMIKCVGSAGMAVGGVCVLSSESDFADISDRIGTAAGVVSGAATGLDASIRLYKTLC